MEYKPGQTVPKTGTVKCTQHPETVDHVIAGTEFSPCAHWGDHNRTNCTWQYV